MIAIIRISGKVELGKGVENALFRLRLRKKYACVVLEASEELQGTLNKLRDFVAYGTLDRDTLKELIIKRARAPGNKAIKTDAEKVIKELESGKVKKSWEELGIKPFFRLHPPRGGIDSKQHYPKGVLGDNKEGINKLIRRML
jgi:large subunit ribosomal protein L30